MVAHDMANAPWKKANINVCASMAGPDSIVQLHWKPIVTIMLIMITVSHVYFALFIFISILFLRTTRPNLSGKYHLKSTQCIFRYYI